MALNLSGLPTSALQPGQTGTAVQQLQQWLVANGFLSQAAYNSGPGSYGPQTTAAVTALQKSLGVNTQGNDGYFGPQTISAIQNSAPSAFTTPTSLNSFTNSVQPAQTTTTQPTQTTTPTLGAPNQTVPAGTNTPGYTYTNGVLTNVGGQSTGSSTTPIQSVNLTPVGGNGSSVVANAIPISQFQGYKLPTSGDFTYNGQKYQVNGGYVIPDPSNPAAAPDLSTFASTSQTNTTDTTSNTLAYDPSWAAYGLTQDQWNSLDATQQATIGAALSVAKSNYSSGASSITLQQALAAAATDPNLVAKYADAAKLDTQTFQQNLQQLQQSTSTTAQQQQTQFENYRKALAEQQAANGTAYSGFRGEAQQQLGQQESGIVQSSKSALQKNLNDATSAFEAKYGTAATTPATATFTDPAASSNISLSGQYSPSGTVANTLTGTVAGGITGTQPIAKQADIDSTASQYVQQGQVTPTTSIA